MAVVRAALASLFGERGLQDAGYRRRSHREPLAGHRRDAERDRWLLATRAIESVLAQELELIVVDRRLGGRGLPRRGPAPAGAALRAPPGRGAGSRPRAQAAAHPWVAFLDDDDLWSPRQLSLTLEAAAEDGGAEWAYSAQLVIDERSRPHYVRAAPGADGMHGQLVRRNTIGTPSCGAARRVRRVSPAGPGLRAG